MILQPASWKIGRPLLYPAVIYPDHSFSPFNFLKGLKFTFCLKILKFEVKGVTPWGGGLLYETPLKTTFDIPGSTSSTFVCPLLLAVD